MIIARRRFLLARQAQRRDEMGGVPAIQVEDGDRNEPESDESQDGDDKSAKDAGGGAGGARMAPKRGVTRGRSGSFVEQTI